MLDTALEYLPKEQVHLWYWMSELGAPPSEKQWKTSDFVYVQLCQSVYLCLCSCPSFCVCLCMYLHAHVHACVCVCVCVCLCMPIWVCAYVYTCPHPSGHLYENLKLPMTVLRTRKHEDKHRSASFLHVPILLTLILIKQIDYHTDFIKGSYMTISVCLQMWNCWFWDCGNITPAKQITSSSI